MTLTSAPPFDGMDTCPDVKLSPWTATSIAAAHRTARAGPSRSDVMAEMDVGPFGGKSGLGHTGFVTQRQLEELSAAECFKLLNGGHVGRVVYVDDDGPVAVPVNYALADHDVVVRVEGGAKQAAMAQSIVAFEVDHIDEDERAGWSVLIRGHGREVPIEEVPALLRDMEAGPPRPWAIGVHKVWLRIVPALVTGRRLGAVRDAMG